MVNWRVGRLFQLRLCPDLLVAGLLLVHGDFGGGGHIGDIRRTDG